MESTQATRRLVRGMFPLPQMALQAFESQVVRQGLDQLVNGLEIN